MVSPAEPSQSSPLEWILSDAPLTAAVANCAAAEAHCRIVPLGNIPSVQVLAPAIDAMPRATAAPNEPVPNLPVCTTHEARAHMRKPVAS